MSSYNLSFNLTLQIAVDITNVLGNLKNNLSVFKEKPDSYSDVVPQLEQLFMESGKISPSEPKQCPNKSTVEQQKIKIVAEKTEKKPSRTLNAKTSNNINKNSKVAPQNNANKNKQIKNYSSQDISRSSKMLKM